jgi:hypothetical protein
MQIMDLLTGVVTPATASSLILLFMSHVSGHQLDWIDWLGITWHRKPHAIYLGWHGQEVNASTTNSGRARSPRRRTG